MTDTLERMSRFDTVGFEVSSKESNWAIRVTNSDGDESVNILGCQIRAVANIVEAPKTVGENCLNMLEAE